MPPNGNQFTPPSSTSSNGASPNNDQQFRVVRKRNRIPLSCAPCRHRKLKCNRKTPCDNCSKRGDTASCSYAAPGARGKGRAGGQGLGHGTNVGAMGAEGDEMQNRIDRLEGLVLSLMTSGQQAGGQQQPQTPAQARAAARAAIDSSRSNSLSTVSDPRLDGMDGNDTMKEDSMPYRQPGMAGIEEDSEVEQVSEGLGIMKMDNGRTLFASDAHWYAILGEISEVKNYFAAHKEDYKNHMQKVQAAKADESPGTAFLLQGGPPAKDKTELLASFPSKADADRLIARYFNAYDPSVHIIHGPSFQQQYDRHWLNPSETSVAWLGTAYAMMTLALQSYHRANDEPPEYRGHALSISHTFRRLTAQCLLLADITQPIAQILETLILHVQAEYGRSRDAEPGVLLLVSLCVRLAMRMGYHRDPAPHPQISPFEGEMRRRVWTFVRQCDLLISFQFGLPAMIRSDHIDAQPPRNLYDDELHEDMPVLPPSRPSFEATPMSYMIAKSKMTFIFGRIVERTQSISNPPSYEETMRFDAELQEARSTHSPLLQMRSFQESARDPANLIMQRLGLEMVYLRSLFVLHRRFIARGRENPRYAYSRRTCIDASMQLLNHQATLHKESQPGGRLRSVKWYISSLTTHDFLLAAMLVCLDLYHAAEAERRGGVNRNGQGSRRMTNASQHTSDSPSSTTSGERMATESYSTEYSREEMLRAVEHCLTIWESLRERSMEAYKASLALNVMVEKLKAHQRAMVRQQNPNPSPDSQMQHGQQGQPYPNMAAPTAQMISTFQRSPNFGIFPNGQMAGDLNTDDLPPEQSAAMTLGMLSSGGISPGQNFGGGMGGGGQQNQQQNQSHSPDGVSVTEKGAFPASMAALLNEPLPDGQGGRPGLMPGYPGPDGQGAISPFSQLLAGHNGGAGPGFMGMQDGMGGDIDWGAWDQYIQGTTAAGKAMTLDPAGINQMWPMNIDSSSFDGGSGGGGGWAGGGAQHQQQQQQASQGASMGNGNGGGGAGVFMGAGTPNMGHQ